MRFPPPTHRLVERLLYLNLTRIWSVKHIKTPLNYGSVGPLPKPNQTLAVVSLKQQNSNILWID
jgi:hypothetical protein